MVLPRLYPIVDKATLDARGISVASFAAELAAAGVGMVQYRDKLGGPQEVLRGAQAVEQAFAGVPCLFVMNDRADLAALMGWGVHVGQGDLSPREASAVARGAIPHSEGWATQLVGVSTHTEEQVLLLRQAQDQDGNFNPADYVAIGPVFATGTKADAEPVVGLEGVRRARALTKLPLVAIGGITLENARSVIDAGADSLAVIGGLFVPGKSVAYVVRDFLERLR
jgi:thiamine-phosphate pyrophosphorylase